VTLAYSLNSIHSKRNFTVRTLFSAVRLKRIFKKHKTELDYSIFPRTCTCISCTGTGTWITGTGTGTDTCNVSTGTGTGTFAISI